MDLDSDFDEEEEIEFGAGSHRESTGRRTVPEREKSTERDEVRIKSAADGQAAEAAAGQSGFLADLPSGGLSF